MDSRPLLIFAEPVVAARHKLGGGGGEIQVPKPKDQISRMAPKFERLERMFQERRAQLGGVLPAAEPEMVLVFEMIESVRVVDFFREGSIENDVQARRPWSYGRHDRASA